MVPRPVATSDEPNSGDYLPRRITLRAAERYAFIGSGRSTLLKSESLVGMYGADLFSHVDCMEVVQGRAQASAISIVRVFHPEAKVTHEAAIGSMDKKELETVMARGLMLEQPVEMIVSGILR